MDVQVYDAFGREKVSVIPDFVAGNLVNGGYFSATTDSAGSGDKGSITVVGDGVNRMRVEFGGSINTSGAAGTALTYLLRDGASGTGIVYQKAYVASPGVSYSVNAHASIIIEPFTGSRTFYLNLQNSAGTPSAVDATAASTRYIIATWVGNNKSFGTADPANGLSTNWVTVTPGALWSAYASPFGPCQYRRSKEGIVFVKGLLSKAAGTGATAFTLPAGYRPSQTLIFPCIHDTGGGAALARLDVDASGNFSFPVFGAGAVSWASFTLSYFAEQ